MTPVQKLNKEISDLFEKVGSMRKVSEIMKISYDECIMRRRNYLVLHRGNNNKKYCDEDKKRWPDVTHNPKKTFPNTEPDNYDFGANPEWVW